MRGRGGQNKEKPKLLKIKRLPQDGWEVGQEVIRKDGEIEGRTFEEQTELKSPHYNGEIRLLTGRKKETDSQNLWALRGKNT